MSHFQALTTALSATVGIGNIAGAAWAIHYGGPGALFWMWMTALLGAATKFSEVTLAQRYRDVHPEAHKHEGTVTGGPMYYIERGMGERWRWMAVFFAIALGFTAFIPGNAVQANTLADILESNFGTPNMVTGLLAASAVAAVVLGGITRIGKVTAILAPLMASIYVFGALLIIVMNAGAVVPTFALILREAFNPTAGVAGTGIGVLLVTLNWGVNLGQPRAVLERGGTGVGAHRPRRRQDRGAGVGGGGGARRAVHRHHRHRHHDVPRDRHHRGARRPRAVAVHAGRGRPHLRGDGTGRGPAGDRPAYSGPNRSLIPVQTDH